MPEAGRFGALIFYFYREIEERHHLPHVKVKYGDYSANFEINTGRLLSGKLPPQQIRIAQKLIIRYKTNMLKWWESLNSDSPTIMQPRKINFR